MTEINDSQQLFADNEFANGSFEVNDAANGVFLTVHPPEGLGEPVAQKDVWGQLSLVAHESLYDKELVMHVIQEAKGIPTLLFEKTKAKIEIAFSRTRMEATIKVNMKKGNLPVTLADMTAQIAQDGVNYGISNSAVEAALATPNQAFIFANGLPSIDGENAYIKYYVDFAAKGKPVELENGRVDFKNLNNYVIVEKNKMIAQKFPPTPGTPGVNVLGETLLPKPGKDVLLPLGKNVVTDDGLIIKADRAGHVLIINGKVNVSDKIEIKEDIDLTTGNIDFIGSVLVRGSVQNGFSVKAGADVEIHGLVSGGVVEGNNIIVRTGIQGGEHGYVVARESIITKFMENATAYANSNITVSDVILNSKVSAGKHL
ncbi:MAG: FapA family protein, partial [Sporomusaceae bacterium]|nr:FapA family protein [Sporomusaceae bacterium]